MTSTINYYNQNAEIFFGSTVSVDMSSLHDKFLAQIALGGNLLDAGCGSGRDAKAFLQRGYSVIAFDGSAEMVRLASEHTGLPVQLCDSQKFRSGKSTMASGLAPACFIYHMRTFLTRFRAYGLH